MIEKNEVTQEPHEESNQERRNFLKRVGKTSIAVPAAALLLAASQAEGQYTAISGAACYTAGGSS